MRNAARDAENCPSENCPFIFLLDSARNKSERWKKKKRWTTYKERRSVEFGGGGGSNQRVFRLKTTGRNTHTCRAYGRLGINADGSLLDARSSLSIERGERSKDKKNYLYRAWSLSLSLLVVVSWQRMGLKDQPLMAEGEFIGVSVSVSGWKPLEL